MVAASVMFLLMLVTFVDVIFRYLLNAPIPGAKPFSPDSGDHWMLDLGDDQYTRGKPHPMIDPSVRDAALAEALESPGVGLVLLDLVIGYGAHADPAGYLATFLGQHRAANAPPIVASVTGTEADPQRRSAQVATLEAAGVRVAPSNADAAALALACLGLGPRGP